jgi:hypothetical protein
VAAQGQKLDAQGQKLDEILRLLTAMAPTTRDAALTPLAPTTPCRATRRARS